MPGEAPLAAKRGEQACVDDRRFAAAGPADDRDNICCPSAVQTFSDQLVDEALAAEEEARVLLAEWQEPAIGRKAREQSFGRRGVDRFALRAGDEPLKGLPVFIEAARRSTQVLRLDETDRRGCRPSRAQAGALG